MPMTPRVRWNPAKMSGEDWKSIKRELEEVFTPGTPIQEHELIAGRSDRILKLTECVRLKGRHAVIFGERGVGKSSIGNTFHYFVEGDLRTVKHIRVAAQKHDDFTTIWRNVFKRIIITDDGKRYRLSDLYEGKNIDPDDVLLELEEFKANEIPVIVIDELDRLVDNRPTELMADTIKLLSDSAADATIVCIGIADSVGDLISGHESIRRALIPVEMPRMEPAEIMAILKNGVRRCGMTISAKAIQRFTLLCKGLPFYAHLLGLHAGKAACRDKSICIRSEHIDRALEAAIKEAEQIVEDKYDKAVFSERKGNIFSAVLLACAVADRDRFGRFVAKNVAKKLSRITGRKYEVPAFSYHLDEFCKDTRGSVLEKLGKVKRFQFRFRDALIEPFVLLQSVSRKIITNDDLLSLSPVKPDDLSAT